MPAWTSLKPTTATSSPADFRGPVEPTVGVRIALRLIRGYKLLISSYFAGSCRFLPTCSEYAAIAIQRHGVGRGSWLALRRLLRCHPLCAAGPARVPW